MARKSTKNSSKSKSGWKNHIDRSVGKPHYYLYTQAIAILPAITGARRALDLGSGSGDMVVDLVSKGWDVTGVDSSERSGEIITERVKCLKGTFSFQKCEFSSIKLIGNYNLILSFFSLPYGKKDELPNLINQLSKHMTSGGIIALNFFGPTHTWVKAQISYPVNRDELLSYLSSNGLKSLLCLNRIYDKRGFDNNPIHWDVLDVIAEKS